MTTGEGAGVDDYATRILTHAVRGRMTFRRRRSVYGYYAKWEADGTTQGIHDLLREQVRAARALARAHQR